MLFSEGTPLSNLVVTKEMVLKKMVVVKPAKSQGPDKIHPNIVKTLSDVLVTPVTIIFNKSLQEGVVPSDWRLADVTSIFKKGDRTDGSNYRPISLLPIISKII